MKEQILEIFAASHAVIDLWPAFLFCDGPPAQK
jgi:hypothetical protein